jgi:hypothetical protein
VYVAAFPVPSRKWRISSDGGNFPRWRQDEGELYFLDAQNTLMAVGVTQSGTEIVTATPTPLFQMQIPPQPGPAYAVTPDGQRFLVISDFSRRASPITVVANWRGLLSRP